MNVTHKKIKKEEVINLPLCRLLYSLHQYITDKD